MRVFTAVDIEDRKVLLELEKLQRKLDFGFNLVEGKKMHLTLQFFQDIGDEEVEEIVGALKEARTEPFQLKLKGAGVFPSREYVRVVWAGADSEKIFDLQEEASDHPVEEDSEHKFRPHVTLARADKVPARKKKDFLATLEDVEYEVIGKLEVDSVKVFESVPTGNGNDYRVLEEVEL